MDPKQEQYLLLGKTSGGLALEELIKRALSEPGLFAYGELLDLPSIIRASETFSKQLQHVSWVSLLLCHVLNAILLRLNSQEVPWRSTILVRRVTNGLSCATTDERNSAISMV